MPPAPAAQTAAPIVFLDRVDSTNSEAMRRSVAGERGPLWIAASSQHAGRGRAGRSWQSPPGNLDASLLFAPAAHPTAIPQLALVAGIAVHAAIESVAGPLRGLRLKWPNDALVGTAKVAGILAESIGDARESRVVLGIGINLAVAPQIEDRAVTHLGEHGPVPMPETMLAALRGTMAQWLGVWDDGRGIADIRSAWLERAGPAGEPMAINAGNGRSEGLFAGLAADGALLLAMPDGSHRRFAFGDVVLTAG
jgi:BirA family transcriptional regulator, biotin operon repressor / biotin---[acetyl-CoA-carboxylase] ligase